MAKGRWLLAVLGLLALAVQAADLGPRTMDKRWLFVWRGMDDAKEVDRVIERLPAASAAGYNGVVLPANVAPERAPALRAAAAKAGLDLVAVVMGNPRDRNYMEGVEVKDALFVVRDGALAFVPDNPIRLLNTDFEQAAGNQLGGWTMQDDPGVTTFVDREVYHDGKAALRLENVGRNAARHARVAQAFRLTPQRQYRISFWAKTDGFQPVDADVKVLTADASKTICFQTFRADRTQDWKRYDLVFNSLEHSDARLYVGSWGGDKGRIWFDDLSIEEIALVNVLRRPGCPVTVRRDDGTPLAEGRDIGPVIDRQLHPWRGWHEPPVVKVLPAGTLRDGDRVRLGYYHSLIVYEGRLNGCLSEPKIFDDWRDEVRAADQLLHPAAFLMSHDEIRVANRCALCRGKGLTPGALLAWNVKQAAAIIRTARPDAGIWVWSDMFDPQHNAVDDYYAVNGSLKGSWQGLDSDVGVVNWHGELAGRNCQFFADLGLRQILSGYYDGDDDGSAVTRWLANTAGVKGIVGAMYTTWEDKYEPMTTWAKAAWGEARR